MRIPLAQMAKATKRTRRKEAVFRPVTVPATLASDLYAEVYAPVMAAWAGAASEIEAAYAKALASITTDGQPVTDSPAQVGARIDAAELTALRIVMTIRLRLERWAARVERVQRGKWRSAVLTATGVDIGTMLGAGEVRDTLGAAIERNVSLVKSVSEQARSRIGEAVFQGLTQRKPAADVARDIAGAVDMGKRRARNIAADQLTKLSSSLSAERRRQAGIDTWEWVHSGKAHPREEHEARNGKRYSDNPADNAPPPADRPGELPFCGCSERAVLSLTDEF